MAIEKGRERERERGQWRCRLLTHLTYKKVILVQHKHVSIASNRVISYHSILFNHTFKHLFPTYRHQTRPTFLIDRLCLLRRKSMHLYSFGAIRLFHRPVLHFKCALNEWMNEWVTSTWYSQVYPFVCLLLRSFIHCSFTDFWSVKRVMVGLTIFSVATNNQKWFFCVVFVIVGGGDGLCGQLFH